MRRLLMVVPFVLAIGAAPAGAAIQTFSYTGAEQSYPVPAGVTSVHVVAAGASGGPGSATPLVGPGGLGGVATADLAVTPGDVLYVTVGGVGEDGNPGSGTGGYNGGGLGLGGVGGGGGGATDIRTQSGAIATRVIVAGGGGGGSGGTGTPTGGAGGGLSGGEGSGTCSGHGGTQAAGGSAAPPNGAVGGLGTGGQGYAGAGGGYYGGSGSGCSTGSAGGGSGYFGTGTTNTAFSVAAAAGAGSVTVASAATPTVSGVTPAGPANDNAPKLTGTAEAGATVQVFASTDCMGSPVATGTAAEFAGAGITVPVADDTATILHARALADGATSGCSSTSAMYTEDSTAPVVTIDTTGSGAKPTFTFHASEAGIVFQCSIDTGTAQFGACSGPGGSHTPPASLASGTYTFRVRATDAAGNTGAPATAAFSVASATPTPTATPTPSGAPDTRITARPKKKLVTRSKTAKVRFRFTATSAVATFRCKLDAGRDAACDSGVTYKVRAGFHTFRVTAVLNGVKDPTPASFSFTVKRKRR